MQNGFLDNYDIPDIARKQLKQQNLKEAVLASDHEGGVSRFMSGHDAGIPYRFFKHTEFNELKSKLVKYKVFDEILMIEWLVDDRVKPTARVTELPIELLEFETDIEYTDIKDRHGNVIKTDLVGRVVYLEAIGGKYLSAFQRFQEGLEAPGMPLSKWGVLADHEVASLAADGVHSIEQFASISRNRVASRYSPSIIKAFEQAVYEAQANQSRAGVDSEMKRISEQMLAIKVEASKKDDENERLREEMKAMQAQIAKLVAAGSGTTEAGIIIGDGKARKSASILGADGNRARKEVVQEPERKGRGRPAKPKGADVVLTTRRGNAKVDDGLIILDEENLEGGDE